MQKLKKLHKIRHIWDHQSYHKKLRNSTFFQKPSKTIYNDHINHTVRAETHFRAIENRKSKIEIQKHAGMFLKTCRHVFARALSH